MSHLDWHDRAACNGADINLFFPAKGKSHAGAKAFCAQCPVVSPCLRDALSRDQQHGVFGNTTADERRVLIRKGVRTRLAGAGAVRG